MILGTSFIKLGVMIILLPIGTILGYKLFGLSVYLIQKFRREIIATVIILVVMIGLLFVEPPHSEYLLNENHGITCWNCGFSIKSEKCEHCGADIMKFGLLSDINNICEGCNRQLFWTKSGKCYYCAEPNSCEYPKFSSVFNSYEDYSNQVLREKVYLVLNIVALIIYTISIVLLRMKYKGEEVVNTWF